MTRGTHPDATGRDKTMIFALNGATTGPADLQTDVAAASAAGYAGVELRDTKVEAYLQRGTSTADLRELCRRAGVSVASVNALEDSTLSTGPANDAVMERCSRFCAWARALACPVVVAVPSVGGPDRTDVAGQTADALRRMGAIARAHGVRIGFEFLGFPACSVRTVHEAWEIVDQVADPAVGLVIDAFHFFTGGSTWDMLDCLDPSRLFIVHLDDAEDRPAAELADRHRVLPGDGVFPLREFVRRIRATGYDGVYSLELFRPEYWDWDPFDLAKTGLKKMEALFDRNVVSSCR